MCILYVLIRIEYFLIEYYASIFNLHYYIIITLITLLYNLSYFIILITLLYIIYYYHNL